MAESRLDAPPPVYYNPRVTSHRPLVGRGLKQTTKE